MKLNKKQKRTATIASMAALLAVVLGMGGQTFAKYITTATVPAQNATVAKWGVVTTVQGTNTTDNTAFSKKYDNVESKTKFVVAPGTTGSLTFTVTGQPEVASKVEFNMTVNKEVHLDSTYYPIQWTLKVGTEDAESYNSDRKQSMKALGGIKEAFDDLGGTYAAGDNLEQTVVLTWLWDFDDDKKGTYDVQDTTLGNYAATTTPDSSSVTLDFTLSLTVTQVD